MDRKGIFIIKKRKEEKGLHIEERAEPAFAGFDVANLIKTVDLDKLFALLEEDNSGTASFDAKQLSGAVAEDQTIPFENMASQAESLLKDGIGYVINLDEDLLEVHAGETSKMYDLSYVIDADMEEILNDMEDLVCVAEEINDIISVSEALAHVGDIQNALGTYVAALSSFLEEDEEACDLMERQLASIEKDIHYLQKMQIRK